MRAGRAATALLLVAAAASARDGLPRRLRDAVIAQPVTVACGGSPAVELRLRRHGPPVRPTPSSTERFAYQRSSYEIRPGEFVGVARILAPWIDAKGQRIPSGVYSLRYALQPLTKDHFRTAVQRDFLLMLPAAKDPNPALRTDLDALLAASRQVSRTGHPAVIALAPTGTPMRAGGVELRPVLCGNQPFGATSSDVSSYSRPPTIWPRTGIPRSGWIHQSDASVPLWRARRVVRNSPAGVFTASSPATRCVTTHVVPSGDSNPDGAT